MNNTTSENRSSSVREPPNISLKWNGCPWNSYFTEKCRWVPLMSQQTEDRGQKNNGRFSKLLLQRRLAILPHHHSPSEQFVLTWTGLGAGSGPLASPVFVKLERRWKFYFQKGLVRLKYIQGLEDIAVIPRQVFVDGFSNNRPLYSCPYVK